MAISSYSIKPRRTSSIAITVGFLDVVGRKLARPVLQLPRALSGHDDKSVGARLRIVRDHALRDLFKICFGHLQKSPGRFYDRADGLVTGAAGTVAQVGAASSRQSTGESNAKTLLQPLRARYHSFHRDRRVRRDPLFLR
jgi:hypothetical protein